MQRTVTTLTEIAIGPHQHFDSFFAVFIVNSVRVLVNGRTNIAYTSSLTGIGLAGAVVSQIFLQGKSRQMQVGVDLNGVYCLPNEHEIFCGIAVCRQKGGKKNI